jgi:hypothetical protein
MAFVAPGKEELDLGGGPHGGAHLPSLAIVVIPVLAARGDRKETRLRRRQAPAIVARSQLEHFGAHEKLGRFEERLLEPDCIADLLRRDLVGEMAGDVRVIEAVVIEQRHAEADGWHEPVYCGEPVLPIAEIG